MSNSVVKATVALRRFDVTNRQSVLQLSKLVVTTMSGPPHTVCTVQYAQLLHCTRVHMKQYHIWLHKGPAKRLRTSNQQLVVTTVTSNLRNAFTLS